MMIFLAPWYLIIATFIIYNLHKSNIIMTSLLAWITLFKYYAHFFIRARYNFVFLSEPDFGTLIGTF